MKVAERVFPGLDIIIFLIIKIPHSHGKLLSRRLSSSSSIAYSPILRPALPVPGGVGNSMDGWNFQ
jgi:hypothetical protein